MIRHLLSVSLLALPVLPVLPAAAQNQSGDFHWDKAVAAGGDVNISNVNGNIRVVPSTTGHVTVTGVRRGSGADRLRVDVQESSRGVTFCVVYDAGDDYCDDRGSHSHGRGHNWDRGEIDLELAVPTNIRVSPSTVSGNIDVTGAHGDIVANSVSGDITLDRLHASSVDAHTVSGDVLVNVEEFTGRGDLSFHSVSGDVTLELPRDFAADLSMTTVSGDMNSDFPVTLGGNSRMSRRTMNARIGAGGRRLDVSTVSGDLKLRMNK
jgi:hypothetical protein